MSDVLNLTYIAPGGDSVTFDIDSNYVLTEIDGLAADDSEPVTTQAPGQVGVTVTDIGIQARVITVVVELFGDSWGDFWERRAALLKTLSMRPVRPGEDLDLGTLQVERADNDTLEIRAIPRRRPPISINKIDPHGFADIEFYCPDSDFRDTSDSNSELDAGATGFTFPLEHPFEITSGYATLDIENTGDVPAPVRIRVFGELTTPRIINETTGESIEVAGLIADGETLDIETGFGEKSIELVASDGTRTNKMSDLNLDDSDFWHLEPGVNTITLDADSNVSGTAWVTWRNRWSGA